mmetsp:Transcript_85171/g.245891  ORF Transcript_85171/g.245891 Transcript_85171/m.245891 type:complete len:157 (+) Transcript_85171:94-564(+)
MARLLAALVAALACAAAAVNLRRERGARARGTAEMWPFSGPSPFARSAPAASKPAAVETAAAAPRIEDLKDQVMLSSAFGKKTQALCAEAPQEEVRRCRQLAGERLFCALLHRHMDKYEGMQGISAEKERCSNVDIMENAVEAAKDEHEQEEAAQA